MFNPYLLGGIAINYSDIAMNGEIFFKDEQKYVSTQSGIRGFKSSVIARVGLDFNISDRFGIYSDIGTGLSLIQLGVIFSLK
jgi:opacity protein-like surface antigen